MYKFLSIIILSITCPLSKHGMGQLAMIPFTYLLVETQQRPFQGEVFLVFPGCSEDSPPGRPTAPAVSELTVRQASTGCTHCCDQELTVMFCWYKLVRVCYRSRNLILISSTQCNVDISLHLYSDQKLFSVIFPILLIHLHKSSSHCTVWTVNVEMKK